MPSPFPGMDPYLEQPASWSQVHFKLISQIQDELNVRRPICYIARVDQFIWINENGADRRVRLKPKSNIALRQQGKTDSTDILTLGAPAEVFLPEIRKGRNRFIK